MSESSSGARWAILIGVDAYHESLGPLKYSVSDTRLLADVLTSGDDPLPADHVLVLADDDRDPQRRPTYANIHSWLASWLEQPAEDDTVIVYFAGHGRVIDDDCFLVPGDATLQTLTHTGIAVQYIKELLGGCPAQRKILILDACHSGAGKDICAMAPSMIDTLRGSDDIFTMTACDVDEISHECDQRRQSVFSHYLAKALSGACPTDEDGRLTTEDVYHWVADHVHRWAAENRCSQSPQKISETADPIFIRHIETEWSEAKLAGERAQKRPAAEEGSQESASAEARKRAILSTIPEWSKWLRTTWAVFFKRFAIIPIVLPFALLIVISRIFVKLPIPVTLGLTAFFLIWIASFFNYWMTFRTRNRYRKHCAEISLKAGDWIGGADFALGIGRLGVDRTAVGKLLVDLAELAEKKGDREIADQLYQCARDSWDSPHARRVLEKREDYEDDSYLGPMGFCQRMCKKFFWK